MPKIIKNIQSVIFLRAHELFSEYDYESVSMKMIANACGIAVGTLYNYYHDKGELYEAVVRESWQHTFFQLHKAMDQDITQSTIHNILEILYTDTEKRHDLGIHFKRVKGLDYHYLARVQDFVIDSFVQLLRSITLQKQWQNDEDIYIKITYTVLSNIAFLIEHDSSERDKNIHYLECILDGFFSL